MMPILTVVEASQSLPWDQWQSTKQTCGIRKILLYCMDVSKCDSDTLATLDKWVCWSLLECQIGTFLDKDPWNQDYPPYAKGRSGSICGPYKAVLALHKGDEKYLQKAYKTSHTAVSEQVCMVCHASSKAGPYLYTNHGPQARHRETILDGPGFIRDVCGVLSWVKLPGWHPQVLGHDWLHIIDLSLVPEASASCLIELAEEGVFGNGALDEKLRKAHVLFSRACRVERIRTLVDWVCWTSWIFLVCKLSKAV